MRKLSLLFYGIAIFSIFIFGFLLKQPQSVQANFGWGQWGEWTDTSECIATQCGTTEGTKTQERVKTKEVCDLDCPAVQFEDSRYVYEEDFVLFSNWGSWSNWSSNNKCSSSDENNGTCEDEKKGIAIWTEYRRRYRTIINQHACPEGYTYHETSGPDDCRKLETFGPITVQYNKSSDPNKCHRPTGSSLGVPSWAMSEFNKLPQHKNSIKVNCRQEIVNQESQTISCQIPQEEVQKCPEKEVPSMSSEVACGKIDLTFKNPTPWFFSFDYRVDNEPGTDDQYTNMQIANGPWAGLFFGQRFNIVDVPAGTEEIRNLTFGEDTGTHTVAYRLWRGAENDLYLDWVSKEVETNCEPDEEPDPTPTPQPSPTPTPNPDGGEKSSLAHDNLQCPNTEFEAVMDVKRDGNGVKDVKVKFSFNGVTKEATTNENGRAKVSFVIGNGTLTAEPEGFPSQALNIQAPECPSVNGDPDIGRGGQVLGATTLAETGNQSLYAALMMLVSGLSLSAAAYYGYNQAKKNE